MQPGPFGLTFHQRSGHLPFDMMHTEAMEKKLAMQDLLMKQLALENQRLAATHSTLGKELGASWLEM